MIIGVFDSGIGGLTVLKELKALMHEHQYIYIGDSERAPYGDLPKKTIVRYSKEITRKLLKQRVDLIVVACNTVSAIALDELQKISPVPVIGVIEPTKEYLELSGLKKVGLAATTATVSSKVYPSVISVACPEFVPLIEARNFGWDLDMAVRKRFSQFFGKNLEAIILGCTHYPLIQEKLEQFLKTSGERIQLIDPAIHTARYIRAAIATAKAV
ncbi:MAG: glutamate racemase [Firmicutes bacterium]|nr:glutamate racemase [Bacillota bacterium]